MSTQMSEVCGGSVQGLTSGCLKRFQLFQVADEEHDMLEIDTHLYMIDVLNMLAQMLMGMV